MKESKVNPTHSFEVDDVLKVGSIEKALIYKEIKQMSVYKIRTKKDPWIFYSAYALSKKFPYLNENSIQKWMVEMEKEGFIVSTLKNKTKYDKTKSYSLPELLKYGSTELRQNDESSRQNDEPIPSLSTSLSINTGETKVSQIISFEEWREKEGWKPGDFYRGEDEGEVSGFIKGSRKLLKLELLAIYDKATRKRDSTLPAIGSHPIFTVAPLFKEINRAWKTWTVNKTQRSAAEVLLTEDFGIETVKKALKFYLTHQNVEFCPQIDSPYSLVNKWDKLLNFKYKLENNE